MYNMYCAHFRTQYVFLSEPLFISVYNLFLPVGKLLIFYTIMTSWSITNYDISLYKNIWQNLPTVNVKKNAIGKKAINLCYNWVQIS